jgi:hypothetical protein
VKISLSNKFGFILETSVILYIVSLNIVKYMLGIFYYDVGIAKHHQVLILFNILVGYSKFSSKYCWYRQVSRRLKMHLDDLVPNGDFLVLNCLGFGSSVSGIRLDHIGKYMSKF